MHFRDLCRRELRIVFGARATWLVLAAGALLVGHSFVLAVDLYASASRSALGFALMQRELDPLAGIVRPMLGGLHLAASLLVPVVATRGLALERERGSYGALALAAGGTSRVVLAKGLAALLAAWAFAFPVVTLVAGFAAVGGHVDVPEIAVALLGHVLHLAVLAAISLAAAAATRRVAQAISVAIATTLLSWGVDAGDGFAALAWLGRLDVLSVGRRLDPFEHGIVAPGAVAWFVVLGGGGVTLALRAARIDAPIRRWCAVALTGALVIAALPAASRWHRGYDWSEQRRASLPPQVVEGLRSLPGPVRVELLLDREDGRRAQMEGDVLVKLRLARPDLRIETPLDRDPPSLQGTRDDRYGRIVLRAGGGVRETRSTSRKEIVTLIFEAAGAPLPTWSQPPYPGYPVVVEGGRRTFVVFASYVGVPAVLVVLGYLCTRTRRRAS